MGLRNDTLQYNTLSMMCILVTGLKWRPQGGTENKQRASVRLYWLSWPLTACRPPKYPVSASVQSTNSTKVFDALSQPLPQIPCWVPCWAIIVKTRYSSCQQWLSTDLRNEVWPSDFYLRPVLAFVAWVHVCVCVSVCLCVCQSLVCPHDNSWPVQARITKFASEV